MPVPAAYDVGHLPPDDDPPLGPSTRLSPALAGYGWACGRTGTNPACSIVVTVISSSAVRIAGRSATLLGLRG